jgi:hypothetical protein
MVDAEGLVQQWLAGRFPSARVVTETPNKLEAVLPVHRVHAVGGPSRRGLGGPRVSVETFAATREQARAQAGLVADALTLELPGVTVAGGTVTAVAVNALPQTIEYDNPNVRMATALYDVFVHAA